MEVGHLYLGQLHLQQLILLVVVVDPNHFQIISQVVPEDLVVVVDEAAQAALAILLQHLHLKEILAVVQ
jgi:hypothetical protein